MSVGVSCFPAMASPHSARRRRGESPTLSALPLAAALRAIRPGLSVQRAGSRPGPLFGYGRVTRRSQSARRGRGGAMVGFIIRVLITAAGLWVATKLPIGVYARDGVSLLIAGLLLGIVNAVIRPILVI